MRVIRWFFERVASAGADLLVVGLLIWSFKDHPQFQHVLNWIIANAGEIAASGSLVLLFASFALLATKPKA